MMKKRTSHAAKVSLALFVLMGGCLAPSSVMTSHVAHAAEQKQNEITQEEAVKIAKSLIAIPASAKKEQIRYEPAHPEWGQRNSTWNLGWNISADDGMNVSLDAKTGKLINYYLWNRDQALKAGAQKLTPEAAQKAAEAFLNKVAKDEVGKLSKANEFTGNSYSGANELGQIGFHYTRVENGIPFLENGFDITVDSSLNIISFSRNWTEEPLLDGKAKLSIEDAKKKLQEGIKPSLQYSRVGDVIPRPGAGRASFSLVYKYTQDDPSMVDANSGEIMNSAGKTVTQGTPIQPLGSTVHAQSGAAKLIGMDEAQKIAEEWIKKFPGQFRSEGNQGSGTSTDPDGTVSRSWSFSFVPLDSKKSGYESGIRLTISDRGEKIGYDNQAKQNYRFGGTAEKIDSPIPWSKAKENAIDLVKKMYPDRLGELYLLSKEPSKEMLQSMLENNSRGYSISFGWLCDGIPVEGPFGGVEVEVDPKDGEVIGMHNFIEGNSPVINPIKPKLDAKQAVEVELQEKKVLLTYFQPGFDYRYGPMDVKQSTPILVYRLVGSNGVVDAASGKWINFDELSKMKVPQDIANHPDKEALSFAISKNLLDVQDGKLEPDKSVTKAEFIDSLIKMSGQYELRSFRFDEYRDNEEPVKVNYQDVTEKHPYYGAIQQAVKYDLIANGGKLNPDQPITRVEAAQMVIRFLGLSPVLKHEEVFKVPFTDLAPADIPSVALAYSCGLFPVKANQHEFKPKQAMTRADVAVMYQQLFKTFGRR
ncbi:YcdB/YcdC domain-containing protein [Brevibacillus ginsengisoli]|uniref:S-layer homology domain-containing protein n=1 Tax=Brevibacillus ginsengisoli TaxID=363854 RepID=UPI003CF17669